ncbi:hypothetical protein SETIT_5G170500v2 [Setaria italica]|uniref:Uncharacterized protein n=1 Tax=Setaria italica TaxID=4555 RepID=A0A368R5L5_SETIT|nr:hypothetical protein SETIT_5G170500v2 [Setaria italica]
MFFLNLLKSLCGSTPRLLQMCLVSRCSGRPLQEISLWGVTAHSPTEVAWSILIHPLRTLTSCPRSCKSLSFVAGTVNRGSEVSAAGSV